MVQVTCDFNGKKHSLQFLLVKHLPRKALIGFPFFKEQNTIFDLNKNVIELPNLSTSIRLLSTSRNDEVSASFCFFQPTRTSHDENMMLTFKTSNTVSSSSPEEEIKLHKPRLDQLLNEFEDIFQPATEPSEIKEIDMPIKSEYKNTIFHRRDRPRSAKEKNDS
jgi:hypothetical protein